jgi:hypothetical protein
MKAVLEFTLPEDEDEYRLANQARAMHSALWELGEYLRSQYKHTEPEQRDDIVAMRGRFYAILEENGVTLE